MGSITMSESDEAVAELQEKYDKLLEFVKSISQREDAWVTSFEELITLKAKKLLKEIGLFIEEVESGR